MKHQPLLIATLFVTTLAACNDGGGPIVSVPTEPQSLSIDFAAKVNGEPFVCGNRYTVGTSSGATDNSYQIIDYRMYVYDTVLQKDDGTRTPLALEQDGIWQHDTVAMLDFEDGCRNGTVETNTQLRGTLPLGEEAMEYSQFCFKLGMPFEENHMDPGASPSPINASGMLWSWTTGHKFIRVDGVANPDDLNQAFHLHLGSTGCVDQTNSGGTPQEACTWVNKPEICLDNFNVSQQQVVADIGRVFSDVNVAVNTPETAPGCMSGNTDPECITVFPKLGLDFDYKQTATAPVVNYPKGEQMFFRTEEK